MVNEKSDVKAVVKRLDSNIPYTSYANSNINLYWVENLFREIYVNFRPGFYKHLPAVFKNSNHLFSQKFAVDYFKLQGFEYGNWLSQEDRYNYFLSAVISLLDLQAVLKFKGHNLGLNNTIGIAFGARGKGAALAHFEPGSFMINLTRYHRADKVTDLLGNRIFKVGSSQVKDVLMEKTGGMGSFGHEYGHALDYFFGTYTEQLRDYRSLTWGRSVSRNIDPKQYRPESMRYEVAKIIHTLIWNPNGTMTAWYGPLHEAVQQEKLRAYWIRHNEMFARCFELYLSHKLRELKIRNTFLIKNKYDDKWPYPPEALAKKVYPYFDRLIFKMRKQF